MSFVPSLLGDDALRVTDEGFELDVHLNWYRTLPLSSVKTVELTMDGQAISRQAITFAVNGHDYMLDELPERWDEDWFVLDPATLRSADGPELAPGQKAEVALRLGCRIPYILVGPGIPLEYQSRVSKTLVAG